LDFGNIQKSWHAHDGAVTQVRFMFDTHYLVSSGRDCLVKLWDCDSKELITQLSGHSMPAIALVLTQDGDKIYSAGANRSIRVWQRTSEQVFLEEEREKQLEIQLEADASREDTGLSNLVGKEVVSTRATRRNIETIRSTEKLMEVIDLAFSEWENEQAYASAVSEWSANKGDEGSGMKPPKPPAPEISPLLAGRTPHQLILLTVSTIPSNSLYEILIALPFLYAERLLDFASIILESMARADKVKDASIALCTVEVLCRVVLILVHLHYSLFVFSDSHRDLLHRLQRLVRPLLKQEQDQLTFNAAALSHLQRQMTTVSVTEFLLETKQSPKAAVAGKKKTKRKRT